jgi:3-oxoacyl-[acyl-carrier protein] reductase
MSNLSNKVALITGSARGIGRAIAQRYGSLGASVVVNYAASQAPAELTVAEIKRLGGVATAVQADVSKVADIDVLFAKTIEHYGRIDIVVANAGLELVGKAMMDITEAEFDRRFDVNTKGVFFTLARAAKYTDRIAKDDIRRVRT